MRIDSIRLFRVPLAPAHSASPTDRESIIVEMRDGEHIGIGEASLAIAPTDDSEWAAGAFACLKEWLAPALVGQTISSSRELQERLARFQANHRAKSALDIAWWSLQANRSARPVHQLLGSVRTTIPLSVSLGQTETIDQLLDEIRQTFEIGVREVVLKFRPGWGLEMVRAVRQTFQTEPIAIDCDGLCTLSQQEMFYRLEDFFLKYIEQPLPGDDLVGHAMLQESLRTPVCLDQSVTSIARAEQAADLGCAKMIRIDIARVGGLTPAVAVRDLCREAKIPCGVGGGPHGEVAAAASAALAASCDLPMSSEAYDWCKRPWLLSDSTTLTAGDGTSSYEIKLLDDVAGWGFLLDTELLADAARDEATIRD